MLIIKETEPEIMVKRELMLLLERVVLEGSDVNQTIEECSQEILKYFTSNT